MLGTLSNYFYFTINFIQKYIFNFSLYSFKYFFKVIHFEGATLGRHYKLEHYLYTYLHRTQLVIN